MCDSATALLGHLPCKKEYDSLSLAEGFKPEVPCFLSLVETSRCLRCPAEHHHWKIFFFYFAERSDKLKTNSMPQSLWHRKGQDHNIAKGASHHMHGGNKPHGTSGSVLHKAEAKMLQLGSWQQPRSCQSVEKWLSLHRNDWFIHAIRRERNVPRGRQVHLPVCWSLHHKCYCR